MSLLTLTPKVSKLFIAAHLRTRVKAIPLFLLYPGSKWKLSETGSPCCKLSCQSMRGRLCTEQGVFGMGSTVIGCETGGRWKEACEKCAAEKARRLTYIQAFNHHVG